MVVAPRTRSATATTSPGNMMHGRSRGFPLIAVLAMTCPANTAPAADSAPDVVARQLVLVIAPDWSSSRGTLSCHEKTTGGWRRVRGDVPVTIGRAGCGWGIGVRAGAAEGPAKREGDGRSPAGVFAVGCAFGIDERLDTGLTYLPMTRHHWCVDSPRSPHYNRIVDDRDVGAEQVRGTEPMRRDIHLEGDRCYAVGFMIHHNSDCSAGMGSCIFAHPWKDPATPTSGCTAMAEDDLRGILAWLDADAEPLFALMPAAEHQRRWREWDLPEATR